MLDLSTLTGLIETLQKYRQIPKLSNSLVTQGDGLYCPTCGDMRRMTIRGIHTYRINAVQDWTDIAGIGRVIAPSLFTYNCVQCDALFTALAYESADGPALAVLPSCRGGITTPHTASGVAFYLDQAHKAHSVGANSAAIGMYRGALEHLLFEQGYKSGMLGAKIQKLKDDIKNNSAVKWAMELDVDFLTVLGELGNGSIHPNDGDVTKQATLDNGLLAQVQETFIALLFLVYEVGHKKSENLKSLRAKASMLKK